MPTEAHGHNFKIRTITVAADQLHRCRPGGGVLRLNQDSCSSVKQVLQSNTRATEEYRGIKKL